MTFSERPIEGRTNEAWTEAEVDAAVKTYFDMWTDWLRGTPFVKAERVRRLSELIPARSRQSIELKFMNISSVTSERIDVYLEGYRPLPHIQHDLRRSVSEYLARNRRIIELLEAHKANALPASLPSETATEDLVVAPPASSGRQGGSRPGLAAGAWTAADDFRRRELGRSGEELVVALEKASLTRMGRTDLAKRVWWAAAEIGDGLGYDIASFRSDGSERRIEVKTTNFGIRTPFYITRNEVAHSRDHADAFSLYRVFDFRVKPRLYVLDGSVEKTASLDPYIFVGSPR